MSRIRGKNTIPEMLVRKFLHAQGYRFRLHLKTLPGKPDIVLKKYRSIIDVRGCFWHSNEECSNGKSNTTQSEQITPKRESAILRDQIKMEKWKELGWNVIIVWADCELQPKRKKSEIREKTLNKLLKKLKIANTNN